MPENILKLRHNCWCISNIREMALLIDSNNYYEAFFDLAPKAEKSIIIAGWELDTQLNLGHIKKTFPNNLRSYFKQLLEQKKDLTININCWKPGFYLKFSREYFASWKWGNINKKRLYFHHDRREFLFSSYHEKVAIIDNTCAFLGGIDISKMRWDTRKHLPSSTLRKNTSDEDYPPTHDLQLVFNGQIIEDLEKLLSKRFHTNLVPLNSFSNNQIYLWPSTHGPKVRNIPVALARTEPAEDAYEIENFYLDAISRAKKFIYIENQYFTHKKIIEKLCVRLNEVDGPEIIVIQPLSYAGVFERAAFIKQRNKAIKKLKKADRFNRSAIFYPSLSDNNDKKFILIHSKLLIIDDEILSLGSANLNNRSMRVDSEINICLDAINHNDGKQFIKNTIFHLLSEHLNCDLNEFSIFFDQKKSLLFTINNFINKNVKTLKKLPIIETTFIEKFWGNITFFIDLKHPISKHLLYSAIFIIILTAISFSKVANGN